MTGFLDAVAARYENPRARWCPGHLARGQRVKVLLRDAERFADAVFAAAMERTLQRHDDKGGWDWCSIEYLLRRLKEEVDELDSAIRLEKNQTRGSWTQRECTDVANFAMIIFGKFGGAR